MHELTSLPVSSFLDPKGTPTSPPRPRRLSSNSRPHSTDATSLEYKLDSFSSVYKRLTGKDVRTVLLSPQSRADALPQVHFEFPVVSE